MRLSPPRPPESRGGPHPSIVGAATALLVLLHLPAAGQDACPDNLRPESYAGLSEAVQQSMARADRLFQEAMTAIDWDARIVASRKLLVSAVGKSKGCTLPQYRLGVSYFQTMLFDEAERWLKKAVDGNAGFYEAKVALARVKILTKDLDAALSLSEGALSTCGSYRPALEVKAQSLILLDRLDEARAFLERIPIPAKPDDEWKPLAELEGKLVRTLQGPDWTPRFVAESENYRAFTDLSRAFAEEVCHRSEFIHKVYRRIFPEIAKPKRKYEIWVYPDLESYAKAGAPGNTSGYYDRLFRRLVLFRDAAPEKTFTTLQHEAFHQYLDDYLEIAPSWFNEGLGDYFGAYEYTRTQGREQLSSRPNTGRLGVIQAAIRKGVYTPLPALMQMSQTQMYDRAGIHYPQSWSIIYFILEGGSREARIGASQTRNYRRTLEAYFKVLRAGRNMIQAYHQTFGKLDMKKFEEEWRDFIVNLQR
jgi:hypothetical protein